jgi:hypothetical protein
MPPAGLEPAISASERPQTHALDRAANGIGKLKELHNRFQHYPTYSYTILKSLLFSFWTEFQKAQF